MSTPNPTPSRTGGDDGPSESCSLSPSESSYATVADYESSEAPDAHTSDSAFGRLPDEIIEQILLLTDPNSFASLVLLSPKWRRVSQQPHLYAHHLARCPSYTASHAAIPSSLVTDSELPNLRRAFAREVKRNLFEAYLRPAETRITLISNSFSSSSAPGGEGLQFTSSPKGHHVLAYNSSRMYVIGVRGPSFQPKRELKILRRPVSVCIQDDASLLAVLSSDMHVDVFDLGKSPPKRLQSIILDNSPRTIALSPCGSVLAAAYEGGIEVTSLNPSAMTTKRAVKCEPVDTLAFSFDGAQLLGTTTHSQPSNTVILTAPYYDPGSHMGENNTSALWTTSILFPNTSRDCSHAILLQDSGNEEASWTFTYDRSFETFRAVRIDDLRNGTTYFTGPIPSATSQSKLLPRTLPASSYHGELVSAGFRGKEIWLYGVPEDLSAVPNYSSARQDGGVSASGGLGRRMSGQSPRVTPRMQGADPAGVPQWQVLCDQLRNTLVSGRNICELEGVSYVKWVAGFGGSALRERLVVAARGVNPNASITEEDSIDFVDGGRITLLDFDYGVANGKKTDITIEVGANEPEPLVEEQRDMETEVALVRKRTVAQRRGNTRAALLRGETVAVHPPLPTHPPIPTHSSNTGDDDPLQPRRVGAGQRSAAPLASASDVGDEIEEQEALDAPYTQGTPRSVTTLRRAATAAAMSRQIRATPGQPGYRRADGRAEHPHESDADNWVPPPPPYQKDAANVDLPAFLRHPAIAPAGLSSDGRPIPTTHQGGHHYYHQHQHQQGRPQEREQPPWQRQPPYVGLYPWSQGSPTLRNGTEPLSRQSGGRSIAPVPDAHHRIVSESSLQQRRPSIPRPLSDSFPDRFTVSPPGSPSLWSPSLRHFSKHATHQGDDNVLDRRQSRSPASDSATESLSHRHSVRDSYSNPLALNPPFASRTRPDDGDQTLRQGGGSEDEQEETPRIRGRGEGADGRPRAPVLDLHIPSPTISPFQRHSTWGSSGGESTLPSNSRLQTNALGSLGDMLSTDAGAVSDLAGYPRSAPAHIPDDTTWPSAPRFYQPDSHESASRGKQPEHEGAGFRPPSPPDQPLIISTPTGISGAFDDPTHHVPDRSSETPIFSPRPRRNVNAHALESPGPVANRSEHILASPAFLAGPPLAPSASAASRHAKLNRRRSRLRRSASRRSVVRRVRARPSVRGRRKADVGEMGFNVDLTGGLDGKGVKKCAVM